MKSIQAIYTDSHPTPDRLIDVWFEAVKGSSIVYFSNSSQFTKLRLEHLKGSINIESFDLAGEQVKIMNTGELNYFPEGFFDQNFNMTIEIAKLVEKASKLILNNS